MLLTIDVGNTNTVLGIFENQEILHSWRVKTDPRDTADELWIKYRSLVENYEVTGISLCSTVPAVLRELRTMLSRHYAQTPSTILEPGIKTGVPLLVDNPKEIARERAIYEMGLNAIIVVALVFAIFLSKSAHRNK